MAKADLNSNGFNDTTGVTLTVVAADATHYCLKAVGTGGVADEYYSSATGAPTTAVCT
jgi:hypothetical protein